MKNFCTSQKHFFDKKNLYNFLINLQEQLNSVQTGFASKRKMRIFKKVLRNFKKNMRIVNLYLGIAILALIFIDRSISRFETAEQIVATLIMIPALFHSLIGVRLILQRVLRKQWDAPIPFYTGGNISRDV